MKFSTLAVVGCIFFAAVPACIATDSLAHVHQKENHKEHVHAAVHVNATAKQKKSGIQTVINMLKKIEKKTKEEADKADAIYNQIEKQCLLEQQKVTIEIQEAKTKKQSLSALVNELLAQYGDLGARIKEIAELLAKESSEVAKAKAQRAREKALFEKEEEQLKGDIASLRGAMAIITNKWDALARGDYSMLQLNNTKSIKAVEHALKLLLQAEMLNSADASKLTALVQGSSSDDDDDEDDSSLKMEPLTGPIVCEGHSFSPAECARQPGSCCEHDGQQCLSAVGRGICEPPIQGGGPPSASVYESKQKSQAGDELMKLFNDLLTQFTKTLEEKQAEERERINAFTKLMISLGEKIDIDDEEKEEDEEEKDEIKEEEAETEGEVKTEEELLKELDELLARMLKKCMEKAEEHAEQSKNRKMELASVQAAIQALTDATAAPESFLQLASRTKVASRVKYEESTGTDAVKFLKNFAKKRNSVALTQMAAKLESVMSMGSEAGDDPFVKVKGMIATLIAKIQAELDDSASKKDYCDRERDSLTKQKEKSRKLIRELQLKRDLLRAKADQYKKEESEITVELTVISETRARNKELRDEEHALYLERRTADERAADGIKIALHVLREYYDEKADDKSSKGAATTIIGILEMLEGEIKADMEQDKEEDRQAQKAFKDVDDEYIRDSAKKQGRLRLLEGKISSMDAQATKAQNDIDEEMPNLNGFKEDLKKLSEECDTKAKTLAERVAEREAEIAGLQETLEILETQMALIQTSVKHTKIRPVKRSLRGINRLGA